MLMYKYEYFPNYMLISLISVNVNMVNTMNTNVNMVIIIYKYQ